MNRRTNVFAAAAAALVIAAASVGGVGIAAGASASASASASQTADATTGTADGVALQSPLADLNDLLQRIDTVLETVLDLLRTISRLFGAGGEAGD